MRIPDRDSAVFTTSAIDLFASALGAFILLVMLLLLSRVPWKQSPRGTLAVMTICSYAVMRFFVEFLRADGHIVLGNLTVTQLQCIFLLPCILLLPRWRKSVVS